MTTPYRFAVMAFAIGIILLPSLGNAEAVIGTRLLSAAPLIAATRSVAPAKPQRMAFDWLSNGATAASKTKSKAAQMRNRVVTGQGSWICSPAGFGQKSRCYAG